MDSKTPVDPNAESYQVFALKKRIEQLEGVLKAKPEFHHPDCNWWKWDWQYSWDVTDCNCDEVAAPPQVETLKPCS